MTGTGANTLATCGAWWGGGERQTGGSSAMISPSAITNTRSPTSAAGRRRVLISTVIPSGQVLHDSGGCISSCSEPAVGSSREVPSAPRWWMANTRARRCLPRVSDRRCRVVGAQLSKPSPGGSWRRVRLLVSLLKLGSNGGQVQQVGRSLGHGRSAGLRRGQFAGPRVGGARAGGGTAAHNRTTFRHRSCPSTERCPCQTQVNPATAVTSP